MPKNYLVTGLPRSGTTLLTSLLSENLEVVTFSEPEWLKEVRKKSNNCQEFAQEFSKKIMSLRNDILKGNPLHIKTSRFNQGLPQNYYHRNDKGEIIVDKEESSIIFPKEYADRPFIVKANAQFTACLNELKRIDEYILICVVRNPVSTIMSWRSLNIPVSHGNMKVAEKYDQNFKSDIKSRKLLDKQVKIVEWFFKQYHMNRNNIILVKYEDLIEQTNETLFCLIQKNIKNSKTLKSKNFSKYYNLKELEFITERVKAIGNYSHVLYDLK